MTPALAEVVEAFMQGLNQTLPLGMILYPVMECLDSIWQALKDILLGGENDNDTRQDD